MVLPDVILLAVQGGGTVAFVVGFVDDHEAVLVTQLVEHGRVGIVAGTHGVEVILLDHPQVPLHVLNADDGAGNGIGIMTVDTAELDGASVQEYHIVLNVDLAHTDAVGNHFVGGFDQQGVQVGLLRIPQNGVLDHKHGLVGVSTAIFKSFYRGGSNSFILSVQNLDLGSSHIAVVGKPNPDGSSVLIQLHGGEVIPDAVLGAAQDVYIAEDTGGTELILVFQVAAVTPLQDHNSQGVLTFFDAFSDVELGGGVGNLAVAQVLAIQPYIEAGVHTFEVQVCLRCICILGINEIAQVCAAGILVGYIGRVCREGITDVGVLVLIIAMVLPDAGHGDGIPAGSVEALFKEQFFKIVDALAVLELPVAIQKLKAVGVLTVLYQIVHSF